MRNIRVLRLLRWAKERSFPGFSGIPVYDVADFVWREIRKDNLMTRANSMAFSFFISLFPLIIVGLTLLTYVPSANSDSFLESKLIEIFPSTAENFIHGLVTELEAIKRGGVLSIGFLAALFFSSNGMINMMRGFNKNYKMSFKKRSGLKKRGIAIFLTLLLFVLTTITIVFITFGRKLIRIAFDFFQLSDIDYIGLGLLRWLAVLFLFYSIISVIYKLGPAFRRKHGFLTPGATLATVLIILVSLLLSFIANRFGTWNRIYGSIGSLVLIMAWFQVCSLILLLGFEMNAAIVVAKDKRLSLPEGETLWIDKAPMSGKKSQL